MLINNDCLIALQGLEVGSIDLALCDLPYGQTQNKWDSEVRLADLWPALLRVCRPNAAIVMFGQGLFSARLALSQERLYKYSYVWKKGGRVTGFLNAKKQPLRNHEDILVFYREQPTYNPQMREGKPNNSTGTMRGRKRSTNYGHYESVATDPTSTAKYPITVLDFEKPHPATHQTEKPVALLEWLMRTYTNTDGCVLDPTMGYGSTGVAAAVAGRRFVGIERDPDWYGKASVRISEARQEAGLSSIHQPCARGA